MDHAKYVSEKNIIDERSWGDIISSSHVLNLWIELIKSRNDNSMQKYRVSVFFKVYMFGRNFRNFEVLEKQEIVSNP